jgi:hypothetical protein
MMVREEEFVGRFGKRQVARLGALYRLYPIFRKEWRPHMWLLMLPLSRGNIF